MAALALRFRVMPSVLLAEMDDYPNLYAALLTYIEWHDAEVERLSKQPRR